MVAPKIPLTVVVGTTQPWPELRMCLDALHQQAVDAGAELLVLDGDGRGVPDSVDVEYPQVTHVAIPGASVLQMRAAGMARSKGAVVAVTEDHCRVAPDWCRRIIEAHRDHPEAAVVGGVVENGIHSRSRAVDWASFFVVNGASMPPVRNGAHAKVALQASVSYKQRVVPRDVPPLGRMEWMLNQDLRRKGETLVSDDRIRVEHDQPLTLAAACAIHYHDSRTIAAFRLARVSAVERVVRAVATVVMPPLLFLRTVLPIVGKRRRLGWLLLSLPMIGVLVHCRAAGALVGFVLGAGGSPRQIR
jgi:hypothetical protein